MKPLLALLVTGLFGVGVTACGGASKSTVSSSRVTSSDVAAGVPTTSVHATTPTSLRGDEDDDDTAGNDTPGNSNKDDDQKKEKNYRDSDDGSVVAYGHAAGAVDRRAITVLVQRYYAAAAAGNGATACALIYSIFAESIPEDYGQGPGPPYSRGKTCAVVMSKMFEHFHSQMSGAVVVTGVRVNGHQARALLGSSTEPAGFISAKRERGVWKIDQLVGEPLP